jgi:hypothetical protein
MDGVRNSSSTAAIGRLMIKAHVIDYLMGVAEQPFSLRTGFNPFNQVNLLPPDKSIDAKEQYMSEKRLIYVAGTPCLGAPDAAREIARLSGKPCTDSVVYKFLADPTHKTIQGVQVRPAPEEDKEEPVNPNWTGIPLIKRVRRDWWRKSLHEMPSEATGYPCNRPTRPVLLRWNPYNTRYGARP